MNTTDSADPGHSAASGHGAEARIPGTAAPAAGMPETPEAPTPEAPAPETPALAPEAPTPEAPAPETPALAPEAPTPEAPALAPEAPTPEATALEDATPGAAASENAAPVIEERQQEIVLQRSVRYGRIIVSGGVLGVLVAALLSMLFPVAEGANYTLGQAVGFMALIGATIGLAVGGVVALALGLAAKRQRGSGVAIQTDVR